MARGLWGASMSQARQGYSFFSVTAPGVFVEYELPTMLGQIAPLDAEELERFDELAQLSERHGVSIKTASVRRGLPN